MRPCPFDFRETYLDIGWAGIDEHYRTNWRCIARWIDECGGETLIAARAAYLRARGRRPGALSNMTEHYDSGMREQRLRDMAAARAMVGLAA